MFDKSELNLIFLKIFKSQNDRINVDLFAIHLNFFKKMLLFLLHTHLVDERFKLFTQILQNMFC